MNIFKEQKTAVMNRQANFEELRAKLTGKIIFRGEQGYNRGRKAWNGLYDKYPFAITRCANPSDVVLSVNFVREHQMRLAVKGGGHDYAGNSVCDQGLVIDLSLMNHIEINPEARTARIGGGATVGEFDAAAQEYGLAIPTGTVSSIGIGGLTLGGGSGYLSRRFGLALDSLISVELVTADARVVTASEEENEDLFWAIRGGGGNFGIVTSFKFRLHEVGPEVLSFQAFFDREDSSKVLEFYREFMTGAPDELQCFAFFLHTPPVDPFPEEYQGRGACALIACYSGDLEQGRNILAPLDQFGNPFFKFLAPTDYTSLQKSFDPGMPKGLRWYTRAHYLPRLTDKTIDIITRFTAPLPGKSTMVYLEPVGGATGRVDPAATAFPHRDAAYSLHIFPGWTDPGEDRENITWAKTFHEAMQKESTGGVYVNLMGHDEKSRIKAAYGKNFDRLSEIKKKWDPDNILRMNQNIEPAP